MSAAQAITNGTPDDGAHPYVGQLLFFEPDATDSRFSDPGGWFNCSGTLLDATHVVSAGHCTYGTGLNGGQTADGSGGNDVWINFSETPDYSMLNPSPTYAPDHNAQRYADWSAALDADPNWIRATSYPHPDYNDAAFYTHDMGVLVLSEPVTGLGYGALPSEGLINQLYKADKQATYTPVGYGLESSSPLGVTGGDTRNKATVKINDINGVYGVGKDTAVAYSSNKGKPHTGGTCFGDSGGPTFPNADGLTNTVITVTSFGIDGNCKAGGGGYRLDQPDDLAFLATFGLTPPTS